MIKALVAEDNAVNRELLRELLEARECTVIEACNGQEAHIPSHYSKRTVTAHGRRQLSSGDA